MDDVMMSLGSRKLAAVVLSAGLLLVACNGDDGDGSPDVAETTPAPVGDSREFRIDQVAQDNVFEIETMEAQASELLRITFTNQGSNAHTFTIEDVVDSGTVEAGETKTLVFPNPGEDVEFFCRFHGDQGMKGVLEISG